MKPDPNRIFSPQYSIAVDIGPGRLENVSTITGPQLESFYNAAPDVHAMCNAVGAVGRSDRRFDRAAQRLKSAGFLQYVDGKWQRTNKDGK